MKLLIQAGSSAELSALSYPVAILSHVCNSCSWRGGVLISPQL